MKLIDVGRRIKESRKKKLTTCQITCCDCMSKFEITKRNLHRYFAPLEVKLRFHCDVYFEEVPKFYVICKTCGQQLLINDDTVAILKSKK